MTRAVVIHQPDFLPWLGFFHRLLKADLFIALDHVQFLRRGWNHRDCIKTAKGSDWLTLNIQKTARETAICDVRLSAENSWRMAHLNLLRENYRKAPHFEDIFPSIEKLYARADEKMVTMNLAGLDLLEELLDAKTPRLLSSEMSPQGSSTAMLVDLLKKAGATHYISGLGARDYLDESMLAAVGIELVWQAFRPPVYPQLHGPFVPMLSSIDALFNCGAEGTRRLLRGN